MSVNALKTAAQKQEGPRVFPAMLDQLKKQVALALPKHLNADRMARIALSEFNKNPKLGDCDPRTVFASVIIASQLGLEPGIMGQGYLIPYKGKCTFVPGWKGLVDLAQRSGRASVWTGAVFDGDEFDFDYGSNPNIHHKPCGEDDYKKMTHAYSVGRVRGAEFPVIEVWPVAKIIRHRDRFNKVGGDHYSFQHQEMYSRKIPLLQVLKYMPSSIELSMAQEFEQVAESGAAPIDLQQAIDGTFMAPPDGATETEGGSADSNSGASIPHYDEKAAIEQIRKATTLDILEGVWKAVRNDFTNSSRSLPIGVEAAYNDRKAALEPKG